jgi:DUF4097 and DUF4098 domain-containing protein YvlB
MKFTRIALLIVITTLLVFIVIGAAWAGEPINERRPAFPDGVVEIENLAGSVRIIGWDRDEVQVTGELGDSFQKLEIDKDEDTISIEVIINENNHEDIQDTDLEVHVPRASQLEVGTISATIEASGVSGTLEISSVSGDITVEGGSRMVELATVSGDISLKDGADLADGEFESVSGDIHVDASFASKGSFEAQTVSGDIVLRVPSGIRARFSVETFSGDIENELGPEPEENDSILPSKELTFSTGSGGARFDLTSFSGSIYIEKR